MATMKTVLLLTVLLSVVLTVTAAAVGAAEVVEVPEEIQEEENLVDNEAAAVVPEVVELEGHAAPQLPLSMEGRFYTCPAGWIRFRNGCYLYVSTGRSWSSALAHCNSLGATLPSVHNLFEYSFLQEVTRRQGGTVAWMGGFSFLGWRWVDQTPFNYNFWTAQHTASRYPCIYLNARAGWSNHDCGQGWPSFCVKTSDTC